MIAASALSGLPGVQHAFFTREGGCSAGLYATLNCGPGSKDDPEAVRANRGRTMASLGLDSGALVTVHQVHSSACVVVDGPWNGGAPQADAMATRTPGLALGILTADCAPVLFADPEAGVVAAAHAGWKGARAGILEATVEAMVGLGARHESILAAVGPCIHQPSYEVGPEFLAALTGDDPANGRFFVPSGRDGHHLFDLPGYVAMRLESAGVARFEVLSRDTRREEKTFFSYRRATLEGQADYGRQLSAIALAR
ncbi:MAG: peptidoglycan editing factor PgeF [Magnetospirillum sp. WYHS-4]